MDSCTFHELVNSVEESSFDADKVDTIKTSIHAAGHISPSQVAQLLELISFEDSRLEVAKMAFHHVCHCDRGSYASIVGEALTFHSDKVKLNEYIRQH